MTHGTNSVPTRRRAILVIAPASVVLVAIVAALAVARRRDSGPGAGRLELGTAAWEQTAEGEFESRSADTSRPRILLRASTRGTEGEAVKFMGVRRTHPVPLLPGTRIAVDFDWNRQINGSGLSAALVLAPEATRVNPLKLEEAFWVEFIGVPPGRNARRVIGVRREDNSRQLDAEGWPEVRREGRPIGVQRMEVEVGDLGAVKVFENGQEVYASAPGVLTFDRAYVYLQLSSRSNYPPREVFFDNLVIRPGR